MPCKDGKHASALSEQVFSRTLPTVESMWWHFSRQILTRGPCGTAARSSCIFLFLVVIVLMAQAPRGVPRRDMMFEHEVTDTVSDEAPLAGLHSSDLCPGDPETFRVRVRCWMFGLYKTALQEPCAPNQRYFCRPRTLVGLGQESNRRSRSPRQQGGGRPTYRQS